MTRHSARQVVATYRYFKSHPDGRVATGEWTDPIWRPEDFFRWMHLCIRRKINRQDTRTWRKLDMDYQLDLMLDAWAVNDYARGIRQSGSWNILRTPEMRKRYPHVNTQSWGN